MILFPNLISLELEKIIIILILLKFLWNSIWLPKLNTEGAVFHTDALFKCKKEKEKEKHRCLEIAYLPLQAICS